MITQTIQSQFPYDSFPYRLEFGEKKNITICYFQCIEHLQKHIDRCKLDKKKVKVLYRDENLNDTPKSRKRKK